MLRKYEYRRTLPHYQKDNRAIFATFATHHRWHLPESARGIVVESCLHINGTKSAMHGFVVMPDHVHLVFTPLADSKGAISLPEIFQKMKSESSHRINRLLRRRGRVWQDESFDHVLRHEEGIEAKLEYIVGTRFVLDWSTSHENMSGCGSKVVTELTAARASRPRPHIPWRPL
jgi:REP element-mobilizing transposase RayT